MATGTVWCGDLAKRVLGDTPQTLANLGADPFSNFVGQVWMAGKPGCLVYTCSMKSLDSNDECAEQFTSSDKMSPYEPQDSSGFIYARLRFSGLI